MGEPLRMSIPLVSTNDDISKNFLLSGGRKEKQNFSSVQFDKTVPRRKPGAGPGGACPVRTHLLFATSKLLNLTGSM